MMMEVSLPMIQQQAATLLPFDIYKKTRSQIIFTDKFKIGQLVLVKCLDHFKDSLMFGIIEYNGEHSVRLSYKLGDNISGEYYSKELIKHDKIGSYLYG